MKPTRRAPSRQRSRRCTPRADVGSLRFFDLLDTPEIHALIERELPGHRQRLFTPHTVLSMFLTQVLSDDRSCQRAVNECAASRVAAGLAPCSTDTSSYCRARRRLPRELLTELVRHTASELHEHAPERWRWCERRVAIIDGTTLTMPDTPDNQSVYPQHANQRPGLGFPRVRLSALFSLESGAVLDAALAPCVGKGSDERSQLRILLTNLAAGDVLLGDALFPSYWLLAELQRRGIEGVFEQDGGRRGTSDFRRGRRLGASDHVIVIERPRECPTWMTSEQHTAIPRQLTVRECRVGKGKKAKTLVTTMLEPAVAPKSALAELYRRRWAAEISLAHLKTTLGMDELSCRSASMVASEIWAHLLAYNLIHTLMAQAAYEVGVTPGEISFRHTVQLWCAWRRSGAPLDERGARQLFVLIGQRRVGQRSGRVEPRAIKRRPRRFPRLMEPRAKAQERIRRHGHP